MAGKMDKTMIIVSAVVGFLGLLSAILGFSAEGTKLTISNIVLLYGVCWYPENPALALGVCAAIFLIMAQVTVAVVGGCCGCCKSRALPSETKRVVGVVCAVISWIAAVIAFGLFVDGAAWNATGTRDSIGYLNCYVLKAGIFAGASVLTLVATALGITSYVMLRAPPADAAAAAPKAAGEQQPAAPATAGAGIAMGQLQFPPPGYYGQAPPNYPQYSSPPPQGYGQQAAPNPQFVSPPPAQGYGAHAPAAHQQFAPPPPPAQGYGAGAHPPNQHFAPPPAQGYGAGAHAPNQHFTPPPAQGYGSNARDAPAPNQNQQSPPPQGHEQV